MLVHKISVFLLTLTSYLLLIGCAGWRSVLEIPEPQHPEQFINLTATEIFSEAAWWTSLNDPGLNALLEQAFDKNLTLTQFNQRLVRLQAVVTAAGSGLFPSLSISANYQDNGNFSNETTTAPAMNLKTWDLKLSARYEFDFWGKITAGKMAGLEELSAGREDLRAYVISLSAQVAKIYFQLVELQAQLELLSKIVASDEDYARMTLRRYEQGVASALDVYQAQQVLQAAKIRASQQAELRQLTGHALSVLIGEYPGEGLKLDTLTSLPEVELSIPVGLPSDLIKRRPDVRAVWHRLVAADRRWAAAVAARFPSFSLTGQTGGSSDQLKDALDPTSMVWTAIANLALPLFQGGALKANSDLAESVFKEQLSGYQAKILTAFQDVENALVSRSAKKERVAQYENQLVVAVNSLEIATDRYLRGVGDYLRVFNSQTAYLNAASGLLTSRREYLETQINLSTALGGGWSEEVISTFSVDR